MFCAIQGIPWSFQISELVDIGMTYSSGKLTAIHVNVYAPKVAKTIACIKSAIDGIAAGRFAAEFMEGNLQNTSEVRGSAQITAANFRLKWPHARLFGGLLRRIIALPSPE
jgi:hypothetical protein